MVKFISIGVIIAAIVVIVAVFISRALNGHDSPSNVAPSTAANHDVDTSSQNGKSDIPPKEKTGITYDDLIGNYTDNPDDPYDIFSRGLYISKDDNNLYIDYSSYRGGYGDFGATFTPTSQWPKISNNSITFEVEPWYLDETYQITLTFVAASESSNGVDTIYVDGGGFFNKDAFSRVPEDNGGYDDSTDQGSSDDNWFSEVDPNDPATWDNVPDSEGFYGEPFDPDMPVGYFSKINTYSEFECEGGLTIEYIEDTNMLNVAFHQEDYGEKTFEVEIPYNSYEEIYKGLKSWHFTMNDVTVYLTVYTIWELPGTDVVYDEGQFIRVEVPNPIWENTFNGMTYIDLEGDYYHQYY